MPSQNKSTLYFGRKWGGGGGCVGWGWGEGNPFASNALTVCGTKDSKTSPFVGCEKLAKKSSEPGSASGLHPQDEYVSRDA